LEPFYLDYVCSFLLFNDKSAVKDKNNKPNKQKQINTTRTYKTEFYYKAFTKVDLFDMDPISINQQALLTNVYALEIFTAFLALLGMANSTTVFIGTTNRVGEILELITKFATDDDTHLKVHPIEGL
jgi:hypothetical protein